MPEDSLGNAILAFKRELSRLRVDNRPLNQDERQTRVLSRFWSELAAGPVAGHSQVIGVRGEVLLVRVSHGLWRFELEGRKPEILERVREYTRYLNIRQIKTRVEPLEKQEKEPANSDWRREQLLRRLEDQYGGGEG